MYVPMTMTYEIEGKIILDSEWKKSIDFTITCYFPLYSPFGAVK